MSESAIASTDPHSATPSPDSLKPDDQSHDDHEPTGNHPEDGVGYQPKTPLQKRRRVTRACDECRRKKIKCDGRLDSLYANDSSDGN